MVRAPNYTCGTRDHQTGDIAVAGKHENMCATREEGAEYHRGQYHTC